MTKENENRNTAAGRMTALAVSVLALLVMMAFVKPVCVSAAENATIKISSEKAVSGEEVQVAVTASGDNLGRVEAMLKYDKSLLSYVSGAQSKGDNGTLQLKKSGTGKDIEFKIVFKAKNTGDSELKVARANAYDMDDKAMKCSSEDGSVTISESAGDTGSDENASGENAGDEKKAGEDDQSADPEVIAQPDDGNGQGEKDPGSKKSNNGTILVITVAAVVVIAILLIVIIMMRVKKNKNDPDNW